MSCSEWKEYVLGDICGYRKEKISIDNVNVDNYISTENMLPDKKGVTVANSIPNTKNVDSYINNDVLISNIRPYFKKIWFADKNGGASSDVLIFYSLNKNILNMKYLYYLLSSDDFFDYVMSTSKGTKMPRGDKDAIMKYKVELPPLEQQEKIANILSSLDNKIELNNEMNKTLEEMAQSIFKRWFVDFEFPNEDGEPYKSSGGEMVESELGMIPRGWDISLLGDIIQITSGKRPKEKSKEKNDEFDIPLIGASSIMGYTNDILYNEKILVIGRVGTHGIVQRFNKKVWPSDNTFVIKARYYEYIHQVLNNIDYTSLNVGSTQLLITQTDIKNIEVAKPNEEIIIKFESIVSSFYNIIDSNKRNNSYLEETRNILLIKLISNSIEL